MHILFIGYGKTSQLLAKQLFEQGHQISTVSRSPKDDVFAQHVVQDVGELNLSALNPIDCVYVLLAPSSMEVQRDPIAAYKSTYLDSAYRIVEALQSHLIQRLIIVSSTRVYGEHTGQQIDDETPVVPNDRQGEILHEMEQVYLKHYPKQAVIIRPSGIYGTSATRMQKMAMTMKSYPGLHWSNRIHIEDLSRFLSHMLHVEHPEHSYIVTDQHPQYLHEIICWFQKKLGMPLLALETDKVTGKRLYATRMQQLNFHLQHPDCFEVYQHLMLREN